MKSLLRNYKTEILQILYVIALILVTLPLFALAPYDRPIADDWSYGKDAYHSLLNGEGIIGVIKSSFSVVHNTYMTWEGRYSCVFFDSIMPGIWGEKVYCITPFILLLSLIFSELYFAFTILGKNNRKYVLPIMIPGLIMQIWYVPSIVESFFWYTGAMNYTFINSLSLVFLCLIYSKKNSVRVTIVEVVLAIVIGGGNFSTSICTILTTFLLVIVFSLRDKKVDVRSILVLLVLIGGFLLAVCAPGNSMRISGNFSGQTVKPLEAIWMSVEKILDILWQWSNARWFRPVFLMLIPFMCHAVKKMDWSFRLPLLFSIITIGLYASQIVATMYVDGTVGGGRSLAILMYSYWLWMTLNMLYWIGWIYKKTGFKLKNGILKSFAKLIYNNPGKIAVTLAFIMVIGMYLTHDIRNVSSVKAVRDLRLGLAAGYAREWDERYLVLHDESQENVTFFRLYNRPDTLFYADFEIEEPYTWVNQACAQYYSKKLISVDE